MELHLQPSEQLCRNNDPLLMNSIGSESKHKLDCFWLVQARTFPGTRRG